MTRDLLARTPQSDPLPNLAKSGVRNLILANGQSPGDILMLTAAVRDLHLTYPGKFRTDVRTPSPALWENNPYITKGISGQLIQCEYPLVHSSDRRPYHFVHAFRKFLNDKLGLNIQPGGALDSGELDRRGIKPYAGDLHLSEAEKGWLSQVDEVTGKPDTRFWIVVAGGKTDFTNKIWATERYQEVVDHFAGRIQFVQAGAVEKNHVHVPLRGVIDLVGKTDLRQLVRLIWHADGVVCPVTFFMHAAAALPSKHGRPRGAVVIAGGRESNTWEAYQGDQYLHGVGTLPCCARGGCWRSRVIPLLDGDEKDKSLCERPVKLGSGVTIPKCLDMITSVDVIRAVEKYLEFGR